MFGKLNGMTKAIAAGALFIFATILIASFVLKELQSDYVSATRIKIAEQETTLASLSELIGRDGADSVVSDIIQDCSPQNRERFDLLLGRLSTLQGQELREVEQLFNACANFYPERKAVMVARFEREYEVYMDLIDILTRVDNDAPYLTYQTTQWEQLVRLEKERSDLSTRLVDVQGTIIRALIEGTAVSSEQMQQLLGQGQEIKDSLVFTSMQIDELRASILDL
jgi:hypothetical protein